MKLNTYVIYVFVICSWLSMKAVNREMRPPLMTIESEFDDKDSSNPTGPAGVDISRETIPALRLMSTTTPLHSSSDVLKPQDITLDASGQYAIVALRQNVGSGEDGGLVTVDIQNPFQTQVVGETLVEQPHEVVVNGDYAFTCASNGAFRIIDISDITQPTIVGSVNTGNSLVALAVDAAGTRAYCADDSGNGIIVFDISNKTSPATISVSPDASGFNAGSVRLDDDRNVLFVTDFTNQALKAFDTQSAPILQELDVLSLPAPQDIFYLTLDTSSRFAFVGESGLANATEIIMVDISDVTNLQEIERSLVNSTSPNNPNIHALQVANNNLYVSHSEGASGQTAFISTFPYTKDGFAPAIPYFTGCVQDAAKVGIGAPGDGPISGFFIQGNLLYLPLSGTNADRGSLSIVEEVNLVQAE